MVRWAMILMWLCAAPAAWAQIVIREPITEGERLKLDAFIQGREILRINDFGSMQLDSVGPVEHFIFRKAVLLGGLNAVFEPLAVPNSARARELVASGSACCSGAAQWHLYYARDADRILESDEVIAQGAYEKGLYTTKENLSRLKLARTDDLRALRAVSTNTWVIDWGTLERLPFKALYSAPTRPQQFSMVKFGRADVTLQDFTANPGMSAEEQGVTLYPVPGVKIALLGTRHFFISRSHPDGPKIYEALQKGLQLMRQSGELRRILVDSGFINRNVRDWTLLNPQAGG